jgi:nitric oxide reductase subunit C
MESNIKKNKMVIATMIFIFIIYNILIYTQGTSNNSPKMSEQAIKGEQIWQNNNCTSCHQLYGLGGYLGPDLTNVISEKGPAYVNAMINSGIKVMPKFNLNNEERAAIVQFLTEVDTTGFYPNYEAKIKPTGWVSIIYKNQ